MNQYVQVHCHNCTAFLGIALEGPDEVDVFVQHSLWDCPTTAPLYAARRAR